MLPKSQEYEIRYSTLKEMDSLRKWLKYKGMLHWYPPSDDQELENFIRIWMGFCRYSASLTAFYKNESVGIATLYLMPYRKVAHHAMFQIIVDPEFQRQGVGKSLLENLKHLAKTFFRIEMLYAEMLDDGSMIDLLKKLDFHEFARHEKYVKEGEIYYPRILMGADL